MHSNLLDSGSSVLVVVDIQSRLTAAMSENAASAMTTTAQHLLKAAQMLDVPVLLTEQYPQGLGPTVAEIAENLPESTQRFEKTGFSCCAAVGFDQALAASGRRQAILIGQETHVCVLQTALDLLHNGYRVYVVEDAVCSRQVGHKLHALQRMQQQGATIVSGESVMFEWLRDARHPSFKALAALLR